MKMSYSFHFSWEKRGKWNEKELFVPLLSEKREKWNEYELIVPLFKEKEREEE